MLTSNFNLALTSNERVVTFYKAIDFIYEKQHFHLALYLVGGNIFCYKKNKLVSKIKPPCTIGVDYILKNKASPYRIHIVKNTKVIFISKKDIQKS